MVFGGQWRHSVAGMLAARAMIEVLALLMPLEMLVALALVKVLAALVPLKILSA